MDLSLEELEVVCVQCSFPMIPEKDEKGNITGFKEEQGPKTEEDALAEGWMDHGQGLYCPKCSAVHLSEMALDEAAGATTGAGDFGEALDYQFLRTMCPDVSEDTINVFVKVFSRDRLNKLRIRAGIEVLPRFVPNPKDEAQAAEFLAVAEIIAKASKPKEG